MGNVPRRAVALASVAMIAAAAWWWLRHDDAPASPSAPTATAGSDVSTSAKAATALRMTWLGQPGVAPREIAGTVVRDGAPVAGASVRLVGIASQAGLIPQPRAITDSSGRFDLGAQVAMEYVVIAEATGATGATAEIDARDPTVLTDELVLVLAPCDASIHGTIRDAAGGVVAKARVETDVGLGTDASEGGAYDLCVPIGSSVIVVSADGYASVADDFTVYTRTRRDFELGPEASIVGRVIREDTGEPVRGITVAVISDDWGNRHEPGVHRASSDADGTFHAVGLSPGSYSIDATGDGLANVHSVHGLAEIGAQEPVTCPVTQTAKVSGRLVERGTGRPVSGASLMLLGPRSAGARTQVDGTFVVDGLRPGNYEAQVADYELVGAPRRVVVSGDDRQQLALEVGQLASISGRIVRAGQPIEGAEVRAGEHYATSDHEGRYTVRGLAGGTYAVYAESQRAGAFNPGPQVSVATAEHKTGIDVELALAASIAGAVVDQNGDPVAGAIVRFSLLHGEDYGTSTTADDGTFISRAMAGAGDYVYQVSPGAGPPYKPADGHRPPPIHLANANAHVTGITLRVRVERESIAGHVVDSAGKPLADVAVRAEPKGARHFSGKPVLTDARGAFTISGLEVGAYSVVATSPIASEHVEAQAGRKDVVIRMTDVGSVEGTLEGFGADVEVRGFRRADDSSRSYYATVTGNTFSLTRLPVGEFFVSASSPHATANQWITVTTGTPVHVTLRNQGFGAIHGTAVDGDTHAPFVGASCHSNAIVDHEPITTDDRGQFKIERALTGDAYVYCYGKGAAGSARVLVVRDETVELELKTHSVRREHRASIGIELETQFDQVIVRSVVPGGPAERAGVAPGDDLEKVGPNAIDGTFDFRGYVDDLPIGSTITLTLGRGDKHFTVTLTVEDATR